MPPIASPSRSALPARMWIGAGTLIGISSGFVASVIAMERFRDLGGLIAAGLFIPIVVVMLVSGLLGGYAATAVLREVRLHRRDEAMRVRLADAPLLRLRDVEAGVVRVIGRIRAAVPTYTDGADPCVACQHLPDGEPVSSIESAIGTDFVIEDDRGSRATVLARHVIVAAGYEFGGECVVPPGAIVEVVGRVSRRAAVDGACGYRDAPTDLTLCGTINEPIVMRCVP